MNYDIVIVGAGIQGAAVAQAAAAAGYSVQVLEQYDRPAMGTSSRSSKLIHGGLRYLETGQFSLVRECLVERAHLIKNAPHLVELKAFHIPIYTQTTRSQWVIMAGLMLYSLFSLKGFHRIPKSKWNQLDGLRTDNLKAVFSYYDGQTDDAKLTQAVLLSAASLGADIQYNAVFQNCEIHPEGCTVHYIQDGKATHVETTSMVNAAGPWVGQVAAKISPPPPQPDVDLVQGTHIEIEGKADKGMYYLEAPQDQRAVFVMPWKGHLMIGTTEKQYQGDPAKVKPLEQEIEYLLEVYNHYFKQSLDKSSVINSFAGLRVLPKSDSKAFSRPRDTVFICDDELAPRVLSLYGGKLTAHRATALDVMQQLSKSLPAKVAIADTSDLPLPETQVELD